MAKKFKSDRIGKYKHKIVPNAEITAIQYLGDKNKFYVVELLKGKKFQAEFARHNEAQMKIAIGDDDFFNLYERQWLFKTSDGDIGVASEATFLEYYEPV